MSDLYDIALGVNNPQEGFVEEMEVGSPTPAQGAVVPGSPEDQLLRDLDHDQWPSQEPGDQPELVQELSDGSSSVDENDNGLGEELLDDDLDEVVVSEDEVQEIRSPPLEEDAPMDPAPAPEAGSRPPPPPSPKPEMGWVSWKEGEGLEPAKTERAPLGEQPANSGSTP